MTFKELVHVQRTRLRERHEDYTYTHPHLPCTMHTCTMPGNDMRAVLILICPLRGVSLGTRGARGHTYMLAYAYACSRHNTLRMRIPMFAAL